MTIGGDLPVGSSKSGNSAATSLLTSNIPGSKYLIMLTKRFSK